MRPKAFVFDLFDTLVPGQSALRWRGTYSQIAAALEVDDEAMHEAWQSAFADRMTGVVREVEAQIEMVLGKLGAARGPDRVAAAAAIKRQFLTEALQPKHDALETLEALRARGMSLGLATDCSWDIPAILDRTPLGPYFEARACSAFLGARKPDPRMYRHVLEQLGLTPEECFYVGDGNSFELEGARELGMTTVWVDNGPAQQFKERWSPGGDYRIEQLGELLGLVEGRI
jgi:putative hydrolase of the HAD superfamily